MASRSRATAASVIGWVIVALLAIWLFGIVVGTIRFVIRSLLWLVLIGVLLAVYFKIKDPPDV